METVAFALRSVASLMIAVGWACAAAAPLHVAMDDMEVLSPFSSWANAMVDYGAKGDGVTDDAPALQRALNDLGRAGKASVLYLPAGTYRLGETLTIAGSPNNSTGFGLGGVSIVGDSPATTSLIWAGPVGAAMLVQNGGWNTSYSRMTFDGSGTAGYGIAQWWNAFAGTVNSGSSEHVDMVFQDMAIGIMAGRLGAGYGQLDSEGQVRRVTFLRMSYAGLDTGSFNALDWTVFDSQFIDCARGVTNDYSVTEAGTSPGAGAFYIYRSLFERSTVADVEVGNTGWFSMHNNVSIGSRQFFLADGAGGNGAPTIIEGNRILDTTNPISISNGNLGAVILIDNQIRSAPGSPGPVVQLTDWVGGADVVSVNNRYTVALANAIEPAWPADRVMSISDTTVAYSSISSAMPVMPATPARVNRQVFEVPSDAKTAQIQAAINQAVQAASAGSVNPIVHLPPGTYLITSSLVIPPESRIQVVGDALTTLLMWEGPDRGSIFELQGPSYATLRNMQMWGTIPSGYAISMTSADQPGGRIFMEGSAFGPLTASGLSQTQITAQQQTGITALNFFNVYNFVDMGSSVGPLSASGTVNMLVADSWYEGTASAVVRMTSGTVTYIGAGMAPATHTPAIEPIVPAILLNDFQGSATFIGVNMMLYNEPRGVGIEIDHELPSTNALFLGMGAGMGGSGSPTAYFDRTSSGGNVALAASGIYNGVGAQVRNQGDLAPGFILSMLDQARSLIWDSTPYQAPIGATDVRFYRLVTVDSAGVTISGL